MISARQRIAMTTDWNSMDMADKVEDLNARLIPVEEMGDIIGKIYRHLKVWGPVIVTAAVSSGIVSGRWGAFFHALVNGQ